MADASQPKTATIFMALFISAIALFFVTIGLLYYFQVVLQREIRDKVELAPAPDLAQLRVREDELLHQYAWVDRDRGLARIPIERAMALEARHPWRGDPKYSGLTLTPATEDRKTSDAATRPNGS